MLALWGATSNPCTDHAYAGKSVVGQRERGCPTARNSWPFRPFGPFATLGGVIDEARQDTSRVCRESRGKALAWPVGCR